jgi:hypothetical protein
MTFKPPANSEGDALPPRHRPNMVNLTQDTTESDLWAFDDMGLVAEDAPAVPTKAAQHMLPIPRESEKVRMRQLKEAVGTKFGGTMDRLNNPLPTVKSGSLGESMKPVGGFDDLDSWDESVPAPSEAQVIPGPKTRAVVVHVPVSEIVQQPPLPVAAAEELSPPAQETTSSASLRPRLHLSQLERIGLVLLLALLGGAGVVGYFLTIHRLPIESELAKALDLPIQGKHLTILAATSYWRAPQAADTARRGTQLLPVLKLKSSGGPAAVRVFFRNNDGDLVGDAVTRSVQAGVDLEVVATAGFEDVGLHAAYRNGPTQSWTIEVCEAPTENSAGPEFMKILKMNIATDRR